MVPKPPPECIAGKGCAATLLLRATSSRGAKSVKYVERHRDDEADFWFWVVRGYIYASILDGLAASGWELRWQRGE